ncbi:MAG TPA: S-layer homology domain-containing protein [Candidatus Flavonifractor merdigallinarum]|uniref:S-layer homology domain-containing protein n=1 Tax=Candidatus Flavonifractor merdigallinarum TaxID=2838589 RepID=A0A9D1Y9J5_9FIRM|nr:S-layer homology domain-containing protein [Candidatus Flavonifractor merdigallinarum]
MRKAISAMTAATLLLLGAVTVPASAAGEEAVHTLVLHSAQEADGSYSHTASYDGEAVPEYDYVWHADPSQVHDEVKDSPAEYYTGDAPDGGDAVYIAHDIYYYPELDTEGFQRTNYDGAQEWVYHYTAEGYEDYLFSTLPVSGSQLPTDMMHSAEEAYENAVLHITQPGTYQLEGEWHGQIWIDLGDTDETFTDETAKVTLILNGVDVTCTVAPSLVFYSVYECDNTWESQTQWSTDVDTSDAGAKVILADGTENNFSGTNVFRILKTKYKNDSNTVQKKRLKMDGAFYSYVSMEIDGQEAGTGVLNVNGGYEGLDTELHLTFNGGNVHIVSQDDGINVNEDGVSVVTVNGGSLHIVGGVGSEGDGIDSNGFLVINGGVVIATASPAADSGLDSDGGSYINGGYVVATGSTMDWAESDSNQVTMNLQFSSMQSSDEAILVTDLEGKVVFAYDPDQDETTGSHIRSYQGAVISCPQFAVGETYHVYVGGDVEGTEVNGLYDAATVTGFSDQAQLQSYTGTDVGMGRPGGGRPDGQPGQPPEGMDPGTFPSEPPEGMDPGTFPGEPPEGMEPGTFPGQRPGDQSQAETGPASTEFYMTDKVNAFSGVADASENTHETPDTPEQQSGSFTDVAPDSWYAEAVSYLTEQGLMSGTTQSTFSPDTATSRGMIATILYRIAGSPAGAEASFSDVAEGQWYTDGVCWAAQSGVTAGYGDGSFGPNDSITREQLAVFLYRFAQVQGMNTTQNSGTLDSYSDAGLVSDWALPAMNWAVENGLLAGKDGGRLDPQGPATRAEAAQILMNFLSN